MSRCLTNTAAVKENHINILRSFMEQVTPMPNEDCIWTPGRTFSWSQTNDQVLRYAHFFLSQGIKRGDIVAFYLQNSAEFMFAWLGLLAINAAPAMINFNLQGKALVHCIGVAGAKCILVDEELAERVTGNEEVVGMGIPIIVLSAQLKYEIEALPAKELDPGVTDGTNATSTLALRYTSGTTGFPKAVKTPISRTYQLVFGKFSEMGLRPGPNGDRWYICMPMCHATAGSTVMACLIMGVTICIG
jgi:acyl-CoA synthetase (AMP-forming)/AMP-acid ligase II